MCDLLEIDIKRKNRERGKDENDELRNAEITGKGVLQFDITRLSIVNLIYR